jgi:HEAT repeat protein
MLRIKIALIILHTAVTSGCLLAQDHPPQPSFHEVAAFVRKPKQPGDSISPNGLATNPLPYGLQVGSRLGGISSYTGAQRDKAEWLNLISNPNENLYTRMCGASLLSSESPEAREFLETELRSTNLSHRYNAAEAVRRHVNRDPKNALGVSLLIKLIEGGGLDGEEGPSSGANNYPDLDQVDIMCSPLDPICRDLGAMKCGRAVPVLIGLLERLPATGAAAHALGELGNPQAIPILMKIVKDRSDSETEAIFALGKLKAKEALPLLLSRLNGKNVASAPPRDPFGTPPAICVLEALLTIGDKSAAPSIRAYLTTRPSPEIASVVKRTLARMDSADPVAALLRLLQQESNSYAKSDLIDALADYPPDARAISALATLAQSSDSALIIRDAIFALGRINTRSSLLVLASLLDKTFSNHLKDPVMLMDPKNSTAYFRQQIHDELKAETGQDLPPEAVKWRAFLATYVGSNRTK